VNEVLISSRLFASYFEANIRVLFDWQRLKRENWDIGLSVITSRNNLTKGFVPWYIGNKGKEVSYSDPDAKPVSLSQIQNVLPFLNKKRSRLITQLSKSFESSRQPIQLVVPTYDLGKRRFILLDGNHRMAALMICNAEFRLMIFKVYGSMDSNILPDLKFWS
jgi:hypothetical protein